MKLDGQKRTEIRWIPYIQDSVLFLCFSEETNLEKNVTHNPDGSEKNKNQYSREDDKKCISICPKLRLS